MIDAAESTPDHLLIPCRPTLEDEIIRSAARVVAAAQGMCEDA